MSYMSEHLDALDQANNALFGDIAVYHNIANDESPCSVEVVEEVEVQAEGYNGEVFELAMTLEVLVSEVPRVQVGASFTITQTGTRYTVRRILSNDGFWLKAIVNAS